MSFRFFLMLVEASEGRLRLVVVSPVCSANIQRERALRRGRAGPATTPSHKFSIHESLPMPFLSWRSQSFRHKSTISPIMHNTKSKKHLSIDIIFNSCVQCSEITDLCLTAESVYSRFFRTRLCRQEFVCFPDDKRQDTL